MKRPIQIFAATVTALAFSMGTIVTPAIAGQNQHYGKGHGYKHGYKQGHSKGYRDGYRKGGRKGHYGKRHFGKRHGYHHKSHYGGRYAYKHRRHHKRHYKKRHYGGYYGGGNYYGGYYGHHGHGLGKTGAAILGVGLGLATAAIISDARRDRYDGDYVVPSRTVNVVPEPAYNPNLAPAQSFSNCLQVREYQSIVIIGGEEREAYGSACLQPDGSWLRGPAQVAPQY